MAYTAAKNQVFHERMKRAMAQLHEVAFAEGDRLDQIYVNETVSGTDEAWQDTDVAYAAECVEDIVLIRALKAWITDNYHTARITPFIQ